MSVSPAESDFDSYVRASGPRLKRLSFLLTGDLDTADPNLEHVAGDPAGEPAVGDMPA